MKNSVASVKKENEMRVTECLNKYSIFFAFGNKQLTEGVAKLNLKDGEKVSNLGGGMFCKSSLVGDFITEFEGICDKNNQNLKEKAGIDNIIRYELSNHECYYTGTVESAAEALASYDITDIELIKNIFSEEWAKHDDW
jgi:hypothetical protein